MHFYFILSSVSTKLNCGNSDSLNCRYCHNSYIKLMHLMTTAHTCMHARTHPSIHAYMVCNWKGLTLHRCNLTTLDRRCDVSCVALRTMLRYEWHQRCCHKESTCHVHASVELFASDTHRARPKRLVVARLRRNYQTRHRLFR